MLEGRPWIFEGTLFSVEDFNGSTHPTDMDFSRAAFWIRMYKLPLACMSKGMGQRLGASMGEVEDVDVTEDGEGWGEYLRVKIKVSTSKPLARGRMLRMKEKEIWIPFQYEKVPKYCFRCGLICHRKEGCERKEERRKHGENSIFEYGPWLRATSPRRGMERERGRRGGELYPKEEWDRKEAGRNWRGSRWEAFNGDGDRSYPGEACLQGDLSGKEFPDFVQLSPQSRESVQMEKESWEGGGNGAGGQTGRVGGVGKGKHVLGKKIDGDHGVYPQRLGENKGKHFNPDREISFRKNNTFLDSEGDVIFGSHKHMSAAGHTYQKKGSHKVPRGQTRTGLQKDGGQMMGSTGPRVADLAALLAQHIPSVSEGPPAKKRQRDTPAEQVKPVNLILVDSHLSESDGKWKKGSGEASSPKPGSEVMAVAVEQPRRSL